MSNAPVLETVKDLDYYMSLNYRIELIPQADGWGAVVPELLGCVGAGDTPEEALSMLEDAKRGWFMVGIEYGHSIPEPEPIPDTYQPTDYLHAQVNADGLLVLQLPHQWANRRVNLSLRACE